MPVLSVERLLRITLNKTQNKSNLCCQRTIFIEARRWILRADGLILISLFSGYTISWFIRQLSLRRYFISYRLPGRLAGFMTSSKMWTVNILMGMSVLATLAPPIVTRIMVTLKVISLPARFWTVSPLLMSAATALPGITWLRRTVLTVSASGALGRLLMNLSRASSVGAKRVRSSLPL